MSFFLLLLSAAAEFLPLPNLAPTRDFEQICFLFQSYMLPLHGVYPYKTHQTSFQCLSWDELLVPCPSLPSFSLLFSWSPLSISSHLQQKRDQKNPQKLPLCPLISCSRLLVSIPFETSHFSPFIIPFQRLLSLVGQNWQHFPLNLSVSSWKIKKSFYSIPTYASCFSSFFPWFKGCFKRHTTVSSNPISCVQMIKQLWRIKKIDTFFCCCCLFCSMPRKGEVLPELRRIVSNYQIHKQLNGSELNVV